MEKRNTSRHIHYTLLSNNITVIWFFISMSEHRGMFQYSLWPLAHLHHIQLGAMNAPIKAAAWDSVTNGPAVQHRWWRPRAVVRIFILMNLDILYRFCCVTTPHLTICTSLHIPYLVLALGWLLLEVMCSVQTKLHLLVSSITIPLGSGLHERMCALHACSIAYNIAAVFVKTPSSTFHHSHCA